MRLGANKESHLIQSVYISSNTVLSNQLFIVYKPAQKKWFQILDISRQSELNVELLTLKQGFVHTLGMCIPELSME